MKAIAFIFARGGSKGLPGKNVRRLGGKPLIAWSIEQALAIERIEKEIVSTDSEEIASIAVQYGAEVPFMRPPELAGDNSPEWLSWQHALNYLSSSSGSVPDVIVSVPATSPLRSSNDIERCLDEYEESNADGIITISDSHRNPYFNMVSKNVDGTVRLVNQKEEPIYRRQDAPVVYDMTTVCYVLKTSFVLSRSALFQGRIRAINIPLERSLDIDTLYDFELAEFLISRNKLRIDNNDKG
jgi:N-acylneuraminate cytidylyltransferase